MSSALLCQVKGFESSFQCSTQALMASMSVGTLVKGPRRSGLGCLGPRGLRSRSPWPASPCSPATPASQGRDERAAGHGLDSGWSVRQTIRALRRAPAGPHSVRVIGTPGERSELSLLGSFLFTVDGNALLGISAGSQRLLAFLALRDQAVPRAYVAGSFWPESSDDQAGASLRAAVSRLGGPARQAMKVTARDLGL